MRTPYPNLKDTLTAKDLAISVAVGLSFLIILFFTPIVLKIFGWTLWLAFWQEYFLLNSFLLFALAPLTAGVLALKLNAPAPYNFDGTLLRGLVASLTFICPFVLGMGLTAKELSFGALFGISLTLILLSFIFAALTATLLTKIVNRPNPNPTRP